MLFCGSLQAAENTAIICSLLGSCKERGVNPREWLNDVISKLPYYLAPKSDRDLKELLPDVWRKQSGQFRENVGKNGKKRDCHSKTPLRYVGI